MSILVDRATRVVVQGITGREGTFHALRCKEYGTQVVGGVTPGKGGTVHEGFPVWNTVDEAVREAGADCALIFVPPAAAADAIMEAAAARRAAGRLHHRGHSGGRHGPGQGVPGRPRDAPPRPELPRAHHARPGQDRHHARPHPPGGRGGRGVAERHPDLRGGPPAHAARPRPVHLRGDRRRSRQRHELRRRAPPLPGRLRDRGDHADRRDRRHRGGRGGGVRPGPRHQARRRLHLRPDRAARAAAWGTPARSSPAARERPPRRCARWRRPASRPSRAPPTWAPPSRACSGAAR